jgi:hypothetical protein
MKEETRVRRNKETTKDKESTETRFKKKGRGTRMFFDSCEVTEEKHVRN